MKAFYNSFLWFGLRATLSIRDELLIPQKKLTTKSLWHQSSPHWAHIYLFSSESKRSQRACKIRTFLHKQTAYVILYVGKRHKCYGNDRNAQPQLRHDSHHIAIKLYQRMKSFYLTEPLQLKYQNALKLNSQKTWTKWNRRIKEASISTDLP
jgi:hypothetical protein